MNIWLEAIKRKVRFEHKGIISVEDLFDLELTDLDKLYQEFSKTLKDISSDSLLDDENNELINDLQLRLDIVKGVFDIKQAEAKALQEKIANLEEKQKIMRIINQKEDAELADLSIEELKAKLDDLQ